MQDSYPNLEELKIKLSPEELDVLRKQYEKEEVPSVQTKFNYAWGLLKSSSSNDIMRGIALLADIYKEEPDRRRECLYFLALGHYQLGNYTEAREYNQRLLKQEPRNEQALGLRDLIDKQVSKDGIIGLAIVGGIAVLGASLVAALFKRSR